MRTSEGLMPGESEDIAYKTALKMLAVQIVAQLPANKEDVDFVLTRVDAILKTHVYDGPADKPPISTN
jgi:hypothetical protein